MLNLELVQTSTVAAARCSQTRAMLVDRSPEETVVSWIDGSSPTPEAVKPLVEVYNKYAKTKFKCISYPRYIDFTMDAIYDALTMLVERRAI